MMANSFRHISPFTIPSAVNAKMESWFKSAIQAGILWWLVVMGSFLTATAQVGNYPTVTKYPCPTDQFCGCPTLQWTAGVSQSGSFPLYLPPVSADIYRNPQKSGYELVFSDEFDQPDMAHFDDDKWIRENYGISCNPATGERTQAGLLVDNRVHIPLPGNENYELKTDENGDRVLALIARRCPPPQSMWALISPTGWNTQFDACGMPYASYEYTTALFQSWRRFKYGYYESRIKLPKERAFWPAFWIFFNDPYQGMRDSRGVEIDIFEIFTDRPDQDIISNHYHHPIGCKSPNQWGDQYLPHLSPNQYGCNYSGRFHLDTLGAHPTFSEEYFVFGMDWSPCRLDFYLNGKLIRTVEDCENMDAFGRVILNLGAPVRTELGRRASRGDFPAEMLIDYVRIYKKLDLPAFGSDPSAGGWNNVDFYRKVEDLNGDGRADIWGVGPGGVLVSMNQRETQHPSGNAGLFGNYFDTPRLMVPFFSQLNGWDPQKHPIELADVNADGLKDIIGFFNAEVYVSTGRLVNNGIFTFNSPTIWYQNDFCYQAGNYDLSHHPRWITDMTGDGKADLVAFGQDGVWVATSNGTSFNPADRWSPYFGSDSSAGSWNGIRHERFLVDYNLDGLTDIVAMGNENVELSLSTGNAFTTPQVLLSDFCVGQGWQKNIHQIQLGDVNGDRRVDIIGFFTDGTYVSLGTSEGNMLPKEKWIDDFGTDQGYWKVVHPRYAVDITGDGKDDIVAFGEAGMFAAESRGLSLKPSYLVYDEFGFGAQAGSWNNSEHLRVFGRVNGDKAWDVVGFGKEGIRTYCSSLNSFLDQFQQESYFAVEPTICDHYFNRAEFGSTKADGTPTTVAWPDPSTVLFSMYPNPSNGLMWVNLEQSNWIGKIIIYDLNGRIVFASEGTHGTTIDLQHLRPGLYLAKLEVEGKPRIQKLVIER